MKRQIVSDILSVPFMEESVELKKLSHNFNHMLKNELRTTKLNNNRASAVLCRAMTKLLTHEYTYMLLKDVWVIVWGLQIKSKKHFEPSLQSICIVVMFDWSAMC